jgi:hypothetical protein
MRITNSADGERADALLDTCLGGFPPNEQAGFIAPRSINLLVRGSLMQNEEQSGLLPPYKRQYLSVLGSFA